MKKSLLIVFILLCLTLKGEENKMLPLLLSATLPGGGQIYNKHYIKASVFSGLEIYFFIQAHYYNLEKQRADNYEDRDHYRRTRDTNLWFGFATGLLAFGDAVVDYKFMTFKEDILKKNDKLSIKPLSNGIALIYEF